MADSAALAWRCIERPWSHACAMCVRADRASGHCTGAVPPPSSRRRAQPPTASDVADRGPERRIRPPTPARMLAGWLRAWVLVG